MNPYNKNYTKDNNPKDILTEIVRLSSIIARQQAIADEKGFTNYGGAIGLQRLRQQRKQLWSLLPAFRLVGGTECPTSEPSSDASTTSKTKRGPSEQSDTASPAPSPGALTAK